jgi:phenylpyruvate tautomerase PptA (4-oxalocrotonate tautomerase family)
MFAGRSVEQKRASARERTEAAVRALGVPPSAGEVLFYDIERHDWAVWPAGCTAVRRRSPGWADTVAPCAAARIPVGASVASPLNQMNCT